MRAGLDERAPEFLRHLAQKRVAEVACRQREAQYAAVDEWNTCERLAKHLQERFALIEVSE